MNTQEVMISCNGEIDNNGHCKKCGQITLTSGNCVRLIPHMMPVQNCLISDVSDSPIDWDKLRKRYFQECVTTMMGAGHKQQCVNLAPHDLFEWFKRNIADCR